MGVHLTGSKKQSVTQKPSSMSEPKKARQAQKYSSFTLQTHSCVSDSGGGSLCFYTASPLVSEVQEQGWPSGKDVSSSPRCKGPSHAEWALGWAEKGLPDGFRVRKASLRNAIWIICVPRTMPGPKQVFSTSLMNIVGLSDILCGYP